MKSTITMTTLMLMMSVVIVGCFIYFSFITTTATTSTSNHDDMTMLITKNGTTTKTATLSNFIIPSSIIMQKATTTTTPTTTRIRMIEMMNDSLYDPIYNNNTTATTTTTTTTTDVDKRIEQKQYPFISNKMRFLRKYHQNKGSVATAIRTTDNSVTQQQNQHQQQQYPLLSNQHSIVSILRNDIKDRHNDIEERSSNINNDYYIPNQFQSIDQSYIEYINDYRHQSIPRWDTITTTTKHGVATPSIIDGMIQFISESMVAYNNITSNLIDDEKYEEKEIDNTTLLDHKDDMVGWYPEILFVIDIIPNNSSIIISSNDNNINNDTTSSSHTFNMYLSQASRQRLNKTDYKVNPAILLLRDSLTTFIKEYDNQYLEGNNNLVSQRWPHLTQLLQQNNQNSISSTSSISIPILFQFCDYTGCNYHNYLNNIGQYQSIPTFTVAANVTCNHTFPFPNYFVYRQRKHHQNNWYETFQHYSTIYPTYPNKIKQIIWRGSLTGNHMKRKYNESQYDIRYQILKLVHSNIVTQNNTLKNIYNMKMIHSYVPYDFINDINIIGGMNNSYYMKMIDFQKYRAIIDMDGYSWSSRFSELLCFNSIILKVEPQYVDSFYYNDNNNNHHSSSSSSNMLLLPWKHYVPIKYDLSDLFEKSLYVLNDNNNEHIQSIIHHANEYCSIHLLTNTIQYEALDILNKYISVLNESSSSWQQSWNHNKYRIMNNRSSSLQIRNVL